MGQGMQKEPIIRVKDAMDGHLACTTDVVYQSVPILSDYLKRAAPFDQRRQPSWPDGPPSHRNESPQTKMRLGDPIGGSGPTRC